MNFLFRVLMKRFCSHPSIRHGHGPLTRAGDLQDGRLGDEDARGREHAGEADGQDFPADGPEQGRQIEPRGVYRGRQVGPFHCTVIAMRSAGAVNNPPDPMVSVRPPPHQLWSSLGGQPKPPRDS